MPVNDRNIGIYRRPAIYYCGELDKTREELIAEMQKLRKEKLIKLHKKC